MQEAGAGSPHLDAHEQRQAGRLAPPRAVVIHEILREAGQSELDRANAALAWSGLAAGLSMGFSFLALCLIRSALPDAPWRHLIDSFGYTVGFVIVVLGRQQLFTESTLTALLPALTARSLRTMLATLRLWAIVLAANLVGTFAFAALIVPGHLFRPEVTDSLRAVAAESVQGAFWATLVKSIFAGWLIALMVWLLPPARSARLLVIVLLTYVVGIGRFSHIVAGSVDAAYAVFTGLASVPDYLRGFLAPTLVGNVLGGTSLVALLNHAPVVEELAEGARGNDADQPSASR